jgi:HlyD family secretion protein
MVVRKYGMGVLIAVLFIGAAVMMYAKLHARVLPENLVQGSGRIDGDLINLNVKYPGRIEQILKENGDGVKRGEVIAIIGSAEQEAKAEQIEAQLEARNAELASKRIELAMAKKTLPQILVKADANVIIKQRQRDELDSMIHAQKSVVTQSEEDAQRMKNLFENRLIEKRQYELARLKAHTDDEQLSGLIQKREQLEKALEISRSDQIDASVSQGKITAFERGIEALESGIKGFEAGKKEMDAVLAEMKIVSPIEGYVVEKIANSGEVIGAGMPIAALIDPGKLYLKIFVDTLQNGKIKMGDAAVLFLDAYPDRPIKAKVVRIEQKAEFTPKEVSVASDRIQRVFAVHLKPLESNPLLKMGLPAVGVISLDGKGLPASLREVPE